MANETIGQRLLARMRALNLNAVQVAELAGTSKETVGNYARDRVEVVHVKAAMTFSIAHAVGLTGHELLYGTPEPVAASGIAESRATYDSHPVQLESWKVAFQLVAEVLDDRGKTLPPDKRAEVTLLAHDFIVDGMPRAKVLRIVHAAAA